MGRTLVGDVTKPHLRKKFKIVKMGEEPTLQHMVKPNIGTAHDLEDKRRKANSPKQGDRT